MRDTSLAAAMTARLPAWRARLSVETVRSLGTVVVIVGMVIFFSAAQSSFLTVLNWQNIAIQMSVLLVIAVAGTFPILIGSIDLSVSSIATLCGILMAKSLTYGGLRADLAVAFGLAVGLACGLINGVLVAVLRAPSFLATLGTFFALDGLASYIISGTPIPIQSDLKIETIFDTSIGGQLPLLFVWALGVMAVAVALCRFTLLGRYFYAVGGGESAAFFSGVNVRLVKIAGFAASGLLAGFAGMLLSIHSLSGSSQQSASLLLPSIGAIVIGGTALSGGEGGPHRTFLGVLLLTILINGMQLMSVDPYLQLVIEGVVVIVAVVLGRKRMGALAVVK